MFERVLIANRGEIACRIIKTCKRMGIYTVAVFSSADRRSLHCRLADEAIWIGESESSQSYLNIDSVLDAAKRGKVDAIHPGYGFLAENAVFATKVQESGFAFVGPTPAAITMLGDKLKAKEVAKELKVPIAPSFSLADISNPEQMKEARAFCKSAGFPMLVKAAGGGGGRGMRRVNQEAELEGALLAAAREAKTFFGDGRVFIEKLLSPARHVEVQILGDRHGNVIHLFDRDCSLQRNNQKVVEEAPAPGIAPEVRERMFASAISLGKRAGYSGAGTVEFLFDGAGQFFFLEVNSRLQVEHPVTEMVTGLDLVELQLRVASREKLSEIPQLSQIVCNGCAIEARVCAEDPFNGFVASTGKISRIDFPLRAAPPSLVRVDAGFLAGDEVTHYYDSLLAKVVAWGPSREAARQSLLASLEESVVFGLKSNVPFLTTLLDSRDFQSISHHVTLAPRLMPDETTTQALRAVHAVYAAIGRVFWEGRLQPETWKTSRGFRVFDQAISPLLFSIDDERYSVSLRVEDAGEFMVEVGTQRLRIVLDSWRMLPDGMLEIKIIVNAEPCCLRLWMSEDSQWVQSPRLIVRVLDERPRGRAGVSEGSGDPQNATVLSHLPGKVIAVHVSAGQHVQAGDVLLVIESMKMEHPIKAPHAGKVSELAVQGGEVIPSGKKLCIMSFETA